MRGSTDSTKKCAHLLVRKDKILNFLRYLVLNNPAYANIVINNERIENLVVGSEGYIVVREFDAPDEVGGRLVGESVILVLWCLLTIPFVYLQVK